MYNKDKCNKRTDSLNLLFISFPEYRVWTKKKSGELFDADPCVWRQQVVGLAILNLGCLGELEWISSTLTLGRSSQYVVQAWRFGKIDQHSFCGILLLAQLGFGRRCSFAAEPFGLFPVCRSSPDVASSELFDHRRIKELVVIATQVVT